MERIPLTNRTFEGDNNVYLFADGPETVLVDTGDRMAGTREELETKLATHGVAFSDVDRIVLTHWHGDHRGMAGPIQQASDAEVLVHHADADLVSGDPEAWENLGELQEGYFEEWGMPTEKREVLQEILDSMSWLEDAPEVTPITGGDVVSVNGRELRAVHAPGHSAGLCMFETTVDGRHEVLTGDALLPKYTPNVGGADSRVDRPLAKYLRTLDRIIESDYDRAWPGHRDVIADPADRAAFIIHHHEKRAYRVLDTLRQHGPCQVWTVSDHLFGELEHIHILHGPGESSAHLSHLEREGSVVREGDTFRLAEGVAAELDALDRPAWNLDPAQN